MMLRHLLRLSPLALALLATHAGAAERPSYNARYDHARTSRPAPALATSRLAVTSSDRWRAVPTFAWASFPRPTAPAPVPQTAEAVARHFLGQQAAQYRVSPSVVDAAVVHRIHDTGRGGIVVTFQQRLGGVEVFGADTKVLLTRQLELVAIGGNMRPEALPMAPAPAFLLAPQEAVATAFTDLYGVALQGSDLVGERPLEGGYTAFDLAAPPAVVAADLRLTDPARAKKVLFPLPSELVPAYYLELFAGKIDETTSDSYAYVVAADDGRVLYRQNLTHADSFSYRVFADPTGDMRPLDGPIADHTPHPTGIPDGSYPAYVSPILLSIDGFNTNPNMSFDSWLPANATVTTGNNVDAYCDHNSPDGYSNGDVRPTTTGPNAFDRVFDTSLDPLADTTQIMAAATQMFFVTNWLHDWWYDSGFDEEAGNAQQDNFGRGGMGGDRMRAEGQDGVNNGSMNNANMSTPADGQSPRMQMYVYSAPDTRSLTVQPLNQSLNTGAASFGPDTFDVTANVVLVDDGAATITDACQAIVNNVSGAIALIDRGNCTYESKVKNAEAAGAVGAIIINNQGGGPPTMGGSAGQDPTIGVLSVTQTDGNAIKASLMNGQVSAHLVRVAGVRSDSTLDNMIIAHEWGHYLHHRLLGSCSNRQCGGMSEGWGDFLSLHTMVREGDDLTGTFARGMFANVADPDPGYYGSRRTPYSVDMTKDALTFKHISTGEPLPTTAPMQNSGSSNNAEVHNTGEVWATMMFEAYVGLLQRSQSANPPYSFDEARRRMADYIVTGMQLTPNDPTFTEQRDALLAAAGANDIDDMLAIAQGFANRGAGSCAVSPPRDSLDQVGVIESYAVSPQLTINSVTLSDDVKSCDDDGKLDAGETATLTVDIENTGPIQMTNAEITITTTSQSATLVGSAVFDVGPLQPFATDTLTAEVRLVPTLDVSEPLEIDLNVNAPEACSGAYTRRDTFRLNYDNAPDTSASDDFDSDLLVWTPAGSEPDVVWSHEDATPLDGVWRGIDLGRISDTWIESPDLIVSGSEPLMLTLVHRYSFEVDDTPVYWDGGVIEISSDGGNNWQDVADFDDPGYSGPLSNQADNPLSDRMAFAAQNPSWPMTDTVTVDLGDNFAGDTVKVRFRIGTDQAASDFGWEIHSVAFTGIDNTPFPSVVDDASPCAEPPTANAGPDQAVHSGDTVTLDGTASSTPDGATLAYAWTQVAGPAAALDDATVGQPSFTAPPVTEDTTLTFELTVAANEATASDRVDIVVSRAPDAPLVIDDGCGCSVPGSSHDDPSRAASLLALLGAAFVLRRKRRR